jgi:hypothetical protein
MKTLTVAFLMFVALLCLAPKVAYVFMGIMVFAFFAWAVKG